MAEDHDLNGVRLEIDGGGFVVACGCGWRSNPEERVREAALAWQRHRATAGPDVIMLGPDLRDHNGDDAAVEPPASDPQVAARTVE